MRNEWMAMERYRIQVMELWPDGPRKEAGIASARSSLQALAGGMSGGAPVACVTYTRSRAPVTEMPVAQQILRPPYELAA